jgi:hypothetical protein
MLRMLPSRRPEFSYWKIFLFGAMGRGAMSAAVKPGGVPTPFAIIGALMLLVRKIPQPKAQNIRPCEMKFRQGLYPPIFRHQERLLKSPLACARLFPRR